MRSASERVALLLAIALAGCAADTASEPAPSEPGPTERSDALVASPEWLLRTEASGTWIVPEHLGTVHAWLDARVANVRYDKRVFVEVYAPYGEGVAIRTLHVTTHRGAIGSFERWGTDTIEIYPTDGPGGRALSGPVLYRLRMQHDLGSGDVMVVTPWQLLYGEGEPQLPVDDPWDATLVSPVRPATEIGEPEIVFAPFEDPGVVLLARIRALTERAQRGEHPTLHLAVMNVNDREIEDALIEAHRAGVEVRVVHDARKHRPAYGYYQGDDRLLLAGVPLLGVRRPGTGAMHDKIVLFDGAEVATGSMNLESGARFENHENVILTREPSLVAAYAERFEAIAGGVLRPRGGASDPSARVSVSFAPDGAPYRIVGELLDRAEERIVLAMFTAKDVEYVEHGRRTSLLTKLREAAARGVEVIALLDHGIHEASEHYGVVTADDPIDEQLAEAGVHVVLVDVPYGRYASMHHKFAVIDDAIAVTGAFNWYHDAAFANDEDQLVWRDPRVARAYLGEAVDMLRRYDPDFDASEWPSVEVRFEIERSGTAWGETVAVAGSLPELGAWDPARALRLGGEGYPIWRGAVRLPIGVRFEAKAIVLGGAGVVWEPGADRALAAGSDDNVLRWVAR